MAKRTTRRVETVNTADVQGEGSFVKVHRLTWESMKRFNEIGGAEAIDKLTDEFRDLLAEHVEDWDWVDDNNEPLPKPKGNPDVFKELVLPEVTVIANAVVGVMSEDEEKN